MPYKFATEDQDFSDFAGGRVLYSLPGLPAFPVRLASEIFQRMLARLPGRPEKRLTLYDPTCGGAYHLAALGLLHGKAIGTIIASDIDPRALELAQRNLGLLSTDGLKRREQEIWRMLDQYGKESHAGALSSAAALKARLEGVSPIRAHVFHADALDRSAIQNGLAGEAIHLVISDVPYGHLSAWHQGEEATPGANGPIWRMLDALLPALTDDALVAIAADKSQKIAHEGYRRVERFQIGKRQVSLLSAG
jgi:hypothetical protein